MRVLKHLVLGHSVSSRYFLRISYEFWGVSKKFKEIEATKMTRKLKKPTNITKKQKHSQKSKNSLNFCLTLPTFTKIFQIFSTQTYKNDKITCLLVHHFEKIPKKCSQKVYRNYGWECFTKNTMSQKENYIKCIVYYDLKRHP